jgi:hypothetical protein
MPSDRELLVEQLILRGKDPVRNAVDHAVSGDHFALAVILRSSRTLTPDERALIADYLEGKIKRSRGRPKGTNPRVMVGAADVYRLKHWARANGKRHDPGFTSLHNQIVEFVAERRGLDQRTLENYLRRPKKSRAKKRI